MTSPRNLGVTVDLIVEDEKGILLIKRKHDPFKGYWALPGGFLNYGTENLQQAAVRELHEETHVKADAEDLILIGEYSEPDRDPRGHIIAHAYYVKKFSGKVEADDDADDAKKFPRNQLPPLAFDHGRILEDYFGRMARYEN